MENEMSFKSTISDNLSDFKTISKLLSNNNFDVELYDFDRFINYINNEENTIDILENNTIEKFNSVIDNIFLLENFDSFVMLFSSDLIILKS